MLSCRNSSQLQALIALPSRMSQDPRILNLTRGFRLKYKQALRAINECACVWVDPGVSVRDTTLAECISLRSKQKKVVEPLGYAELRGVTFKPPIGAQAAYINECRQAFEANKFYSEAVQ